MIKRKEIKYMSIKFKKYGESSTVKVFENQVRIIDSRLLYFKRIQKCIASMKGSFDYFGICYLVSDVEILYFGHNKEKAYKSKELNNVY